MLLRGRLNCPGVHRMTQRGSATNAETCYCGSVCDVLLQSFIDCL